MKTFLVTPLYLKTAFVVAIASVLVSCSSSKYAAYDENDGIYGSSSAGAYETDNRDYYRQYFNNKAQQYENLNSSEDDLIFTDVENYTSSDYIDEQGVIHEQYSNASYGGWGDESSNVVVNVYPSYNHGYYWYRPYWWYSGGWGLSYWGGYYGSYWHWNWYYPSYYYGYGYYGYHHHHHYYNHHYYGGYSNYVAYNRGRNNTDYNGRTSNHRGSQAINRDNNSYRQSGRTSANSRSSNIISRSSNRNSNVQTNRNSTINRSGTNRNSTINRSGTNRNSTINRSGNSTPNRNSTINRSNSPNRNSGYSPSGSSGRSSGSMNSGGGSRGSSRGGRG